MMPWTKFIYNRGRLLRLPLDADCASWLIELKLDQLVEPGDFGRTKIEVWRGKFCSICPLVLPRHIGLRAFEVRADLRLHGDFLFGGGETDSSGTWILRIPGTRPTLGGLKPC